MGFATLLIEKLNEKVQKAVNCMQYLLTSSKSVQRILEKTGGGGGWLKKCLGE